MARHCVKLPTMCGVARLSREQSSMAALIGVLARAEEFKNISLRRCVGGGGAAVHCVSGPAQAKCTLLALRAPAVRSTPAHRRLSPAQVGAQDAQRDQPPPLRRGRRALPRARA